MLFFYTGLPHSLFTCRRYAPTLVGRLDKSRPPPKAPRTIDSGAYRAILGKVARGFAPFRELPSLARLLPRLISVY